MIALLIIGGLLVITIIVSIFYIISENYICKRDNIKQEHIAQNSPNFIYRIEFRSILNEHYPFPGKIYIDGDVSAVRKRIRKLRKSYGSTLNYEVYEERNLTNSIDWE